MRILFIGILLVVLSSCAFAVTPIGSGAYVVRPYYPVTEATPTPDDWLTLTAYPIPSPIPTSVEPTPTPIQPLYVCPAGDYVNVRALETTSSAILGTLDKGERALVKTIHKDWTQISFLGQTAYVYKAYVVYCVNGVVQ